MAIKRKVINVNKIELLYGHILVEPVVIDDVGVKVKGKNKTVQLAKPQGYDDKTMYGKVINTASKRWITDGTTVGLVDMIVKKGDDIVFQPYSANKIRVEGKDYLIIHEEDVFFIVL